MIFELKKITLFTKLFFMKILLKSIIITGILVASCAKNPFTGKSTMAFYPNSAIFPSAFQQYNQFLSENKVLKGTSDAKRIETIGMKIKTNNASLLLMRTIEANVKIIISGSFTINSRIPKNDV